MQRVGFVMQLKNGCGEEYKKRHNEIWPELKALLSESGIYDYTIFLEESTGKLFAIQKTSTGNRADSIGDKAIVRKWWDFMADLMEVNNDNSPVCLPLSEVFHLD
ncbi:MAG: L-rhamnose mutarotase [Spirochaetales bacterium]|nr:L-rhamnose mutarotase [Spirochaetales bacterium]